MSSDHDPGVTQAGAVLRRPETPPIVDAVRAEVAFGPGRSPLLLVLRQDASSGPQSRAAGGEAAPRQGRGGG